MIIQIFSKDHAVISDDFSVFQIHHNYAQGPICMLVPKRSGMLHVCPAIVLGHSSPMSNNILR